MLLKRNLTNMMVTASRTKVETGQLISWLYVAPSLVPDLCHICTIQTVNFHLNCSMDHQKLAVILKKLAYITSSCQALIMTRCNEDNVC